MADPTKSRYLIGSTCWPVDLLHWDPAMAGPALLGVVVYHSIWTHLNDHGIRRLILSHLLSLWKTRLRVVEGGTERVPGVLRLPTMVPTTRTTSGELGVVAGSPVVGSHPVARLGAAGDRRLIAGVGGLLRVVALPGQEGTGYEKCLGLFSTSNLLSGEWWWWWRKKRGRTERIR